MQLLIFPKSKADFNSKNKTFKSVFKGIEYDFFDPPPFCNTVFDQLSSKSFSGSHSDSGYR